MRALAVCVCVLASMALADARPEECTLMHTVSVVPGYNEHCDRHVDTASMVLVNTSSLGRATARNMRRGLPPPGGRRVCASMCSDAQHCSAFVYDTDGRCFTGDANTAPFTRATCDHAVSNRRSWAYSACSMAPPRNASAWRVVSLRDVLCDNFCDARRDNTAV